MIIKVIVSIVLPVLSPSFVLRSYKISPRRANAHSYISAGFLVNMNPGETRIQGTPRLVFTGVHDGFVRAERTEKLLENKDISVPTSLRSALENLGKAVFI